MLTWDNVFYIARNILDLGLVWVIVYYLMKIMSNNVRMMILLKGVLIVIAIKFISQGLGLTTLNFLVNQVIQFGLLTVIIIFQPEIRSALEMLGRNQLFGHHKTLTLTERESLITELKKTVDYLSKRRIGALISIENGVSLSDYVEQAHEIHATITSELLQTLFNPTTPLHDGAVIIQSNKISCAGAFFPTTTNKDIDPKLGTRHRAALGISESNDSVTIVVSEETGTLSIAYDGELYQNLTLDKFEIFLKNKIRIHDNKSMRGGKVNEK